MLIMQRLKFIDEFKSTEIKIKSFLKNFASSLNSLDKKDTKPQQMHDNSIN